MKWIWACISVFALVVVSGLVLLGTDGRQDPPDASPPAIDRFSYEASDDPTALCLSTPIAEDRAGSLARRLAANLTPEVEGLPDAIFGSAADEIAASAMVVVATVRAGSDADFEQADVRAALDHINTWLADHCPEDGPRPTINDLQPLNQEEAL